MKAIAMKCTQEQFESIAPKLEGFSIKSLSDNFEKLDYLCNFAWGQKNTISNFTSSDYKNFNREIHQSWNEQIFLEACGIEAKEKTFTITKDQIIQLTDPKLKEWFPEVFEVKQNGWYKDSVYDKWMGYFENDCLMYGFDIEGDYFNKENPTKDTEKSNDRKATEEEVFEALRNEAIKQGFIEGAYFKRIDSGKIIRCVGEIKIPSDDIRIKEMKGVPLVCFGMFDIFKNGKWAEIIPTCTRAEAEKLLNKKIID